MVGSTQQCRSTKGEQSVCELTRYPSPLPRPNHAHRLCNRCLWCVHIYLSSHWLKHPYSFLDPLVYLLLACTLHSVHCDVSKCPEHQLSFQSSHRLISFHSKLSLMSGMRRGFGLSPQIADRARASAVQVTEPNDRFHGNVTNGLLVINTFLFEYFKLVVMSHDDDVSLKNIVWNQVLRCVSLACLVIPSLSTNSSNLIMHVSQSLK